MRTYVRMRHCKKCSRVLPLSEFPVRSSKTCSPCSYCRDCQREYSRQHYRANRIRHNKRRYINQLRYKAENRRNLFNYFSNHGCVDCGEKDPLVLEFDHVRGNKSGDISSMVTRPVRWKRILEEIEKCEVRCANCHRRKTARDFKWFKADGGA